MGKLTINDGKFYMDGKPYTVISGAMHYFRIPREYWRDRLLKLAECGFNTVETYTCWNLHEKNEGKFDFSGRLDVKAYIELAAELGLNVILRPGPYICAEWDFGGLPAWLLGYENIPLRCSDKRFMSKFGGYLHALLPQLRELTAGHGGNIIMLQIENEYGSYGNDKDYLREIAKIYRDCGMDCLYYTSDGACELMLDGGTLDEYFSVANFGSKPKEQFKIMKRFRPNAPLMCGEYWCGWFDHWFEEHHTRTADEISGEFRDFFDIGASVNFYMFHGGTNFGFTNGANYGGFYQPTVTSYDYNALLTEAGDRTEAYYRIRDIIKEKTGRSIPLTACETPKRAYGKLKMTEKANLFENIDRISSPCKTAAPEFMEELGQAFGYMLYRTEVNGSDDIRTLIIEKVHDRAQIFVDGELRAVYDRAKPTPDNERVRICGCRGKKIKLDILAENMGRVNYGPKLRDRKGISGVRFDCQYHFGWEQYPLPMDDLSSLEFSSIVEDSISGPTFLRGKLFISGAPCDSFVRVDGFTKGFGVVNGNNLGRYYNPAGPQKTLYLPAPFLKEGENEIIVFESDKTDSVCIEFTNTPDLG